MQHFWDGVLIDISDIDITFFLGYPLLCLIDLACASTLFIALYNRWPGQPADPLIQWEGDTFCIIVWAVLYVAIRHISFGRKKDGLAAHFIGEGRVHSIVILHHSLLMSFWFFPCTVGCHSSQLMPASQTTRPRKTPAVQGNTKCHLRTGCGEANGENDPTTSGMSVWSFLSTSRLFWEEVGITGVEGGFASQTPFCLREITACGLPGDVGIFGVHCRYSDGAGVDTGSSSVQWMLEHRAELIVPAEKLVFKAGGSPVAVLRGGSYM